MASTDRAADDHRAGREHRDPLEQADREADSLKPAIRLTAPRPTVSAASAERRIASRVGAETHLIHRRYCIVRAITSRWISFVPS